MKSNEIDMVEELLSGNLLKDIQKGVADAKKLQEDTAKMLREAQEKMSVSFVSIAEEMRNFMKTSVGVGLSVNQQEPDNRYPMADLLKWKAFWLKYGFDVDISSLIIPKKEARFEQLIVMPKGITAEYVVNELDKLGIVKKIDNELRKAIREGRDVIKTDSLDRSYVVWIHACLNPDNYYLEGDKEDEEDNEIVANSLSLVEILTYALWVHDQNKGFIARHLSADAVMDSLKKDVWDQYINIGIQISCRENAYILKSNEGCREGVGRAPINTWRAIRF